MRRYRAIADYDSAFSEPLELQAGERVRFERRDTEWEGWVWCTSESGRAGWGPEAWLTIDGPFAVLRRDYCARELTIRRGTFVRGSLIESGWLWATTDAGASGWVPLEVLEQDAGVVQENLDANQRRQRIRKLITWLVISIVGMIVVYLLFNIALTSS